MCIINADRCLNIRHEVSCEKGFLTLNTLWTNSIDDKLIIFSDFFFQKIGLRSHFARNVQYILKSITKTRPFNIMILFMTAKNEKF